MEKIKILRSAYKKESVSSIELDIAPHSSNPAHFHTFFSETFEILNGELFIGKNKETMTLKGGEIS